jgi:hypothetical protein
VGVRLSGHEADFSPPPPPSGAMGRNEWRRTSTPLHGVHRDTFICSILKRKQSFGNYPSGVKVGEAVNWVQWVASPSH